MSAWILLHFIHLDCDTDMWYHQATMWYIHATMYSSSSSFEHNTWEYEREQDTMVSLNLLTDIKVWYKVQTKAPVSALSKVCNITRMRAVWTIALDHIHNPLISYLFEHYHLNLRNQPISYLSSQCNFYHQGERISFTFITNKPATSIQYNWTT